MVVQQTILQFEKNNNQGSSANAYSNSNSSKGSITVNRSAEHIPTEYARMDMQSKRLTTTTTPVVVNSEISSSNNLSTSTSSGPMRESFRDYESLYNENDNMKDYAPYMPNNTANKNPTDDYGKLADVQEKEENKEDEPIRTRSSTHKNNNFLTSAYGPLSAVMENSENVQTDDNA